MEVDPAFVNLPCEPGLLIWRIENFQVVPVQPQSYGKFYSGDSYLILSTILWKNRLSRDIFFWLGEESSQDEVGTCAYKAYELDVALGSDPKQHREVQGHESDLFLSLFKDRGGVRYLDGGIDSGFGKVERDVYETRLFHIKGNRNPRVMSIPLSAKLLNHGDAFILDLGLTLYVWVGAEANQRERVKAFEIANRIRCDERGARAEIIPLVDGENDSEFSEFWSTLSGTRSDVLDAEAGGDDNLFQEQVIRELFKVSDDAGSVSIVKIDEIVQSSLTSDSVFILDIGTEIFVWIGKNSSPVQKKNAMSLAATYLKQENRPSWLQITRLSDGKESDTFRAIFPNWQLPVVAPDCSGLSSDEFNQLKVNYDELLRQDRNEQDLGPVFDDGSSPDVEIWRIEDFKRAAVVREIYGEFYSGDSYIISYTYRERNRDKRVLYFWLGRDSTRDERGAAALLTIELDDMVGGSAVQVRVTQGKEPRHFLSIFKGSFVCFFGGHPSGFSNVRDCNAKQYDPNGISLFHVRGFDELSTRAIQVDTQASSLNSGDSFVLLTPSVVYAWLGSLCLDEEEKFALSFAEKYSNGRTVEIVKEGDEPTEFWDALGGKGEYATQVHLSGDHPPRLFHIDNNIGKMRIEEIFSFTQEDLFDDDVMVLDAWNTVFVWLGSTCSREEIKAGLQMAEEYLERAKRDATIVQVKSGQEPLALTAHFPGWIWEKEEWVDPFAKKNLRHVVNAGIVDRDDDEEDASTSESAPPREIRSPEVTGYFPLEALQQKPWPDYVDPEHRELYLSDADFASAFGMDKAEFSSKKLWRQQELKKKVNLF